MPEPIRLAKRVVELLGCSRSVAEQYIEGGWVLVNGEMVDEPQLRISDQQVELASNAKLGPIEPATLLLHRSASHDPLATDATAGALLKADARSETDTTRIRFLRRHLRGLAPVLPLESAASGLVILTQDAGLVRKMKDDGARIEQEFIVEVAGEIEPYGLARLRHGLSFNGRPLPPIKVSWQNEIRLRFALTHVQPGQIVSMCNAVGLQVVAMRRIRVGSVPLSKLPAGEWRYLPMRHRF